MKKAMWMHSDHETPRALAGSALPAVRRGLTDYLEFYDLDRPHQALGYRTPAEVYFDAELNLPRLELRTELRQEDDSTFRPDLRQVQRPASFDTELPATDSLYQAN